MGCEKSQSYCVCHLVNNKGKKYNEYLENKGRTMLFYNGIGLSLRVFERIKLARKRLEKAFNISKYFKIQLNYIGARDGP